MQRQPSCCDFCGFLQVSQEYPTDRAGISWYVCPACARLIDTESWGSLIERGVAAYAQIRSVEDDEGPVLRKQMEQLVGNFRIVRLAAV
jgi:hypothetical protein